MNKFGLSALSILGGVVLGAGGLVATTNIPAIKDNLSVSYKAKDLIGQTNEKLKELEDSNKEKEETITTLQMKVEDLEKLLSGSEDESKTLLEIPDELKELGLLNYYVTKTGKYLMWSGFSGVTGIWVLDTETQEFNKIDYHVYNYSVMYDLGNILFLSQGGSRVYVLNLELLTIEDISTFSSANFIYTEGSDNVFIYACKNSGLGYYSLVDNEFVSLSTLSFTYKGQIDDNKCVFYAGDKKAYILNTESLTLEVIDKVLFSVNSVIVHNGVVYLSCTDGLYMYEGDELVVISSEFIGSNTARILAQENYVVFFSGSTSVGSCIYNISSGDLYFSDKSYSLGLYISVLSNGNVCITGNSNLGYFDSVNNVYAAKTNIGVGLMSCVGQDVFYGCNAGHLVIYRYNAEVQKLECLLDALVQENFIFKDFSTDGLLYFEGEDSKFIYSLDLDSKVLKLDSFYV